jgi:ribonuclease-3
VEKLGPDARVDALQERISYRFPDRALALSSLIHTSWANEHPGESISHNERLEFLGDAVVDLAISHRLMERFPAAHEGELTKLRALIVNEEGLARVARAIGLGELLLLGRGESRSGGREKNSLLADAFEAVLGAVFLCGGMADVMPMVDRLFSDTLEALAEGRFGADYKSKLQEESHLLLKATPRYLVVSVRGPEHEKIFEVEVTVGETIQARATGRSKKEAEQSAAREALGLLHAPPSQE